MTDTTQTPDRAIRISPVVLRALYPVVQAAGNDVQRERLSYVNIEPCEGGGVVAVATNGHVMAVFREAHGESNGQHLVQLTKEFVRMMDDDEAEQVVFDGTHGWVETTGDDPPSALYRSDPPSEKVKFPDWRRVVPKVVDDERRRALAVDGKYFDLFARVGREIGHGAMVMHTFGDDGSAVVVTTTATSDFLGLIMPLRMNESDFEWSCPDWL